MFFFVSIKGNNMVKSLSKLPLIGCNWENLDKL